MPTYEYHCSNCGHSEEVFQRITEEPLIICPECKQPTFMRVVTGGAGVLYKGEGWYVTDYSKRSSGGKETPPAPAAESKPAQKPSGDSSTS
jgi:putative FmdB family regulatory protein